MEKTVLLSKKGVAQGFLIVLIFLFSGVAITGTYVTTHYSSFFVGGNSSTQSSGINPFSNGHSLSSNNTVISNTNTSLTHNVTTMIIEAGLPAGMQWTAIYNGQIQTRTSGSSISFQNTSGSAPLYVSAASNSSDGCVTIYSASPSFIRTVAGSNVSVNFSQVTKCSPATTIFSAKGLPASMPFDVIYNGNFKFSGSGSVSFQSARGNYPFTVLGASTTSGGCTTTYTPLPSWSTADTAVAGSNVSIIFTASTVCTNTFVENGLPLGGNWSVTKGLIFLTNSTSTSLDYLDASLPSGYSLYLCAGASGNSYINFSWVGDATDWNDTSYGYTGPLSSVGHQFSNVCSDYTPSSDLVAAIAGISSLVNYTLYKAPALYENETGNYNSNSTFLNYSVSMPSTTFILISGGWEPLANVTLPNGCYFAQQSYGGDNYENASIGVCPHQSVGKYSINITTYAGSVTAAAYVFPVSPIKTSSISNTLSFKGSNFPRYDTYYIANTLKNSSNGCTTTYTPNIKSFNESAGATQIVNFTNSTVCTTRVYESTIPLGYGWSASFDNQSARAFASSSPVVFHTKPGTFTLSAATPQLNCSVPSVVLVAGSNYTFSDWTCNNKVSETGLPAAYTWRFNYSIISPIQTAVNFASTSNILLSVSAPTGYPLYLCEGGAGNDIINNTSWVTDVQDEYPYSSIGHQASNTCSIITEPGGPDLAASIIGVNASEGYSLYTSSSNSNSGTLTYNVTKQSFVILMMAAGDFGIRSVSLPSGCSLVVNNTGADTYESGYIATCQQSIGTYNVGEIINVSGPVAGISMAAYVFNETASNTVNLSISTASANISTGAGNIIYRTSIPSNSKGTCTTTYTPNSSSGSFNAGSAVSIAFSNSTSCITNFTESGLPAGRNWNVTYDGKINSSNASSATFINIYSGSASIYNYSLDTLQNESVGCTTTYAPIPESGSTAPGATVPIQFTGFTYCISNFTVSDMPSGHSWYLNVTRTSNSEQFYNFSFMTIPGSSNRSNLSMSGGNGIYPINTSEGNYTYKIYSPQNSTSGCTTTYTPNSSSGSFNAGSAVSIAFSNSTSCITNFTESGRISPLGWWVDYNGVNRTSISNPSITFSNPPGSYSWSSGVLPSSSLGCFPVYTENVSSGGNLTAGSAVNISVSNSTSCILHSFSGGSIDGANPLGSLTLSNNILYGMTYSGGSSNSGTIFSEYLNGTGFKLIHSFNRNNGSNPFGSLTLSNNILYGMTYSGGSSNSGTIFSEYINGSNFKLLHSFSGGSIDGASPYGSLSLSGNILYGMTYSGGSSNSGTIFSEYLNGTGFKLIHSFNGGNGSYPSGSLTLSNNILYGMTSGGGSSSDGVIFSEYLNGTGFKLIHSFNGSNGSYPYGSLTLLNNILYGMTSEGGSSNNGTIFSEYLNGTGFKLIHSFNGDNGTYPSYGRPVILGSTLYGIVSEGGSSNSGTIFSEYLNGTGFKLIHSFNGSNGASPYGSLSLSGNILYGMTYSGGSSNSGTIFSISLNATP